MLTPLSSLERIARDLHLHRARGLSLDRVAAFVGLPRPATALYSDAAWRAALKAVAWGARGTWGSTVAALEGALSDRAEVFDITTDPSDPLQLLTSAPFAFDPACHTHRLVRVQLPALSIDALYLSTASPSITELRLADTPTSLWRAPQWPLDQPYSGTARVLAFLPTEPNPGPEHPALSPYAHPCQVRVFADPPGGSLPPTYLIDPPGEDRDNIDPLMPDGGIIMDEFNIDGAYPPPPTEGFPEVPALYLDGEGVVSLRRVFDALLAAGVRMEILTYEWC